MATSQPNFLLIMSDEHAPQFSSAYGHPLVRSPHTDRLAEQGVLFENAYCNTPLCAPSRMSFMTGRYIHHIAGWDNDTPLASDIATWAHLLRHAGYDVVLSGKQHFVGPDKLHGFRTQLARDLHSERRHPIYPWRDGIRRADQAWQGVYQAKAGTTLEIEVDDQVEEAALTYLRAPERQDQPWALNVSFIAPHFPLVCAQEYWDLYPLEQIDMPEIPAGHLENQHPVYQRMRAQFGLFEYPDEWVRRARAGYYGLITYLDDKIGRLLDALEETGQADNTVVVYISDHGEMNGEHGMWRKSNFYEQSARIPMIVSWPGEIPGGRRVQETVSLVDLVATIVEMAGAASDDITLDGDSLTTLMQGNDPTWKDEAFAEYLAHGVIRPMAMLRRGNFKLNYSLDDPVELYDLATDPGEFNDLGQDPEYASVREGLRSALLSHWNPIDIERQVRQSQIERLLIRQSTAGEWVNMGGDTGFDRTS